MSNKELPLVKITTSIGDYYTVEDLSELQEQLEDRFFIFKSLVSELPYKWELYYCEETITLDTKKVDIQAFSQMNNLERKVPVLETLLKENEDVKAIREILKLEVTTQLKEELKTQLQSDIRWDILENMKDWLREESYKELLSEMKEA